MIWEIPVTTRQKAEFWLLRQSNLSPLCDMVHPFSQRIAKHLPSSSRIQATSRQLVGIFFVSEGESTDTILVYNKCISENPLWLKLGGYFKCTKSIENWKNTIGHHYNIVYCSAKLEKIQIYINRYVSEGRAATQWASSIGELRMCARVLRLVTSAHRTASRGLGLSKWARKVYFSYKFLCGAWHEKVGAQVRVIG